MANTTLRFKDMTFEKVENYDPENAAAVSYTHLNMVKYRIRNKVDELMRIARKIASDHDKGNGYVEKKYFNMWRRYYAQGSKSRKNGKGSVQGKAEWRSRCVAQEQPA